VSALIAGIGNPFFGDDGFGAAVARELAESELPPSTRVLDLGSGVLHLLCELMLPPTLLLIVDATPQGGEPGTLYLIEPDRVAEWSRAQASPEAHGIDLAALFALLQSLGVTSPKTWIIGCEPSGLEDPMQLSSPVREAVPRAIELIKDILARGEPPS
jgi:hydrogenase maturation protease